MNNPLLDIIRYITETNYPNASNKEIDFISYNVMKDIDKEILNRLKEIAETDLKINYPRGNAKSIRDCCRLFKTRN